MVQESGGQIQQVADGHQVVSKTWKDTTQWDVRITYLVRCQLTPHSLSFFQGGQASGQELALLKRAGGAGGPNEARAAALVMHLQRLWPPDTCCVCPCNTCSPQPLPHHLFHIACEDKRAKALSKER